MGNNDKLDSQFKEIYKRLGSTEQKEVENTVLIKQIFDEVSKLSDNFKEHTRAEMTKQDNLNKSLSSIDDKLSEQKHATDSLSNKIDNLDKDFKKTEKDLKTDIEEAKTLAVQANTKADAIMLKIAKWSGGIGAIVLLISIVWAIYINFQTRNEKLEERLRKYETNQAINYGRQQIITKETK